MNALDIQRLLTTVGYYDGDLDGDIGPKSRDGIQKLLVSRASELPPNWYRWGWSRRSVAAGQLILKHAGYDEVGAIDGLVGPSTKHALGLWDYVKIHGKCPPTDWRVDEQNQINKNVHLQKNNWPLQRHMTRFYGQPGGPQCTAGKVDLPFKMRIAWNRRKKISRFSCHEKVADSAERVYRKIASVYSPQQISSLGFDLFGGCYNYRKKRGGSTLSTHAYGVAIDHDPERNQLKWNSSRAKLASPECIEFWRIWESEGWLGLGPARNFDWMHVQAARLS